MTDHIVQFSGGAGSWAAAKVVRALFPQDDCILLFTDTRMEEQEEMIRQHLQKDVTILKEQRGGVGYTLSLRELRERAEEIRATEDGQLDWGGCGCMLSEGEVEQG